MAGDGFLWSRLRDLGLHEAVLKHLLLHLQSSLTFLELALCRLELRFEVRVFFLDDIEVSLHITTFLFTFASTETRTLSVLEKPVLFGWQELAHADELRFGHDLDVDSEVAYPDDVSLFEVVLHVERVWLLMFV